MDSKKLTPIASALALGLTTLTAPAIANADLSASVAASNFYFWRGQNISNGAAAVSGSLDYGHESGMYAGIWTSSEMNTDTTSRSEYDLYIGFNGESGDFSYDISLWSYQYPEDVGSDDVGNLSESIISVTYSNFNFSYYQVLAHPTPGFKESQNQYLTFGYQMDKIGVTLGTFLDDSEADKTHLTFKYTANEEISFLFSKLVDAPSSTDDDLLVNVEWSKTFDL
ncbi:MAG: TorF family putative porin [Pseudomonadales bacterium]|nr:TorF family putative porin [Pseudomonadales bacterium]